jgi:hypothetical protein
MALGGNILACYGIPTRGLGLQAGTFIQFFYTVDNNITRLGFYARLEKQLIFYKRIFPK